VATGQVKNSSYSAVPLPIPRQRVNRQLVAYEKNPLIPKCFINYAADSVRIANGIVPPVIAVNLAFPAILISGLHGFPGCSCSPIAWPFRYFPVVPVTYSGLDLSLYFTKSLIYLMRHSL
jgi:hypothetical protein